MSAGIAKAVWTIGLMGVSVAALGAEPDAQPKPHPHEPIGFVTGAVVGGFAGGPIGAVVGAGIGTWLGNRVHRAGEARTAEAQVAALQADKSSLQVENDSLSSVNHQLSGKFETAAASGEAPPAVLDGWQGDVLFRTGSAQITPQIAHQVQVLALAIAKSPALKVRVDGYADPRGSDDGNMRLSQDRANAVRDMLLAAGVSEAALEVNAYGKTQSVASDSDGYALERRVRVTLQADMPVPVAVAQVGENE